MLNATGVAPPVRVAGTSKSTAIDDGGEHMRRSSGGSSDKGSRGVAVASSRRGAAIGDRQERVGDGEENKELKDKVALLL